MKYYENWAAQSAENRRLFKQEALLVETAEQIWAEMEKHGLSRADLAARLERSKPFVTKILAGDHNMTLRTLSDVADALGFQAHVQFSLPDEQSILGEWHSTPAGTSSRPARIREEWSTDNPGRDDIENIVWMKFAA